MEQMNDEVARQILDKYDEILVLCGAGPDERISTALAKFDSAVETEVRQSEKVKDMSEEEVQGAVSEMKKKLTRSVMLLIAMSVGQALRATGQSFSKMADDREAMKKAADEWFNKWNK